MSVAAEFTTVLAGLTITIGDNSNPNGWTSFFKTAGRSGNKQGYLIFMVEQLSYTADNKNAEVRLNDQKIGEVLNNDFGKDPDWRMQMISFDSDVLHDHGDNELTFFTVPNDDPKATNSKDDYNLREVICHYHTGV